MGSSLAAAAPLLFLIVWCSTVNGFAPPTQAPCWDRSSCAAAVAKFHSQAEEGHPLSAITKRLLRDFMSWVEKDVLHQIPDYGGNGAPVSVKTDKSNYCANNGPFDFIPIHLGTIFPNSSITLDLSNFSFGFDACFSRMEVSYTTYAPGGEQGGESWGYIHFKRSLPRSLTCDDFYGVSTKFGSFNLDISVAHSIVKPMRMCHNHPPSPLPRARICPLSPCMCVCLRFMLLTPGFISSLQISITHTHHMSFKTSSKMG